jgi:imidazolonepropionase-like amidohydrolase
MVYLLASCVSPGVDSAAAAPSSVVLSQATVPGVGQVDLFLSDGRFTKVGEATPDGFEVRDMDGLFVVPAFIDSHVHLAFLPVGQALTEGGVAGAVDLAAPLDRIVEQPLRMRWSGPMVTAEGGYPTQGWGSNGYGLEVSGPDSARAAVRQLHDQGMDLIKLPVTSSATLSDASLLAAVEEAHGLGMKVATHAMADDLARRAAEADIDVLAHTPTDTLSSQTTALWSDKAVVSTLSAFGNGPSARSNLAQLVEGGATLLYGTDLGNSNNAGIDPNEIRALVDAGFTGDAILEAGTSAPALFWGFDDLGAIEEGKAASFLVLDRDPTEDPMALTEPLEVWMDGVRLK